MTWLISIRSDRPRYQPIIAPIPGCRKFEDMIEAERWRHKAAREFRDTHGFLPLGIYAEGNRIDEDRFWPEEGYFLKDFTMLPPLLGLSAFYLVQESWLEAIEEFEPGVHQFKRVPLFRKDGSPVEERYHAINICQALRDASDRKRSTAPAKDYSDGHFKFLKTSDHPKCKVYFLKDRVSGPQLWQPLDLILYNIATSDHLFDRLSQTSDMKSVTTLWIEEV